MRMERGVPASLDSKAGQPGGRLPEGAREKAAVILLDDVETL